MTTPPTLPYFGQQTETTQTMINKLIALLNLSVGQATVTPQQYGAVGDGVTDDYAAIMGAINSGVGTVFFPKGVYLVSAQIIPPTGVSLIGLGATSNNGARGPTCILRGFTGALSTILMSGDDCSISGFDIDNNNQGTGDCLAVWGTRPRLAWISARKSGNDGIRIGKTASGPATINANLWRADQLIVLGNARYGLNIDDTNTTVSATFPLGLPNCNAGSLTGLDAAANGSHGIRFGNTIDNVGVGVVCQSNTGYGVYFDAYAAGNALLKAYMELNVAGDGFFHATLATQNIVMANRAVTQAPVWTNGNVTSNRLSFYNASVGRNQSIPTVSRGGGWTDGPEIIACDLTAGGLADFTAYVETSAVEAFRWRGTVEGVSGGKATLRTRQDGNVPRDALVVHNTQLIDFPQYPASTTYANDAAAAAGGVPVGQIYRNGSVLQVRVA